MANEFASLIQADLASLTNAAADLSASAIAPAAQFGAAAGHAGHIRSVPGGNSPAATRLEAD